MWRKKQSVAWQVGNWLGELSRPSGIFKKDWYIFIEMFFQMSWILNSRALLCFAVGYFFWWQLHGNASKKTQDPHDGNGWSISPAMPGFRDFWFNTRWLLRFIWFSEIWISIFLLILPQLFWRVHLGDLLAEIRTVQDWCRRWKFNGFVIRASLNKG